MLRAVVVSAGILLAWGAHGEIVRYEGSAHPVPDKKFVRVVSENDSPIQQTYIKAKDGLYIAAAIRRPKGEGPFPAIIMFHGAPGGRGMEQLVGWSRGDHGGPVWERFLQEGFVVAVADYRGGDYNRMNQPSSDGLVTAVDDGISVINHVAALPYVDQKQVSVYGVSLGGNLVLFLAAKVPTLKAVIAGAPAPIWFLGFTVPSDGPRPDYARMQPDPKIVEANVAPIESPILILVGTEDRLLGIDTLLHDQLLKHGKSARMEVYEHGYHDFVLGNQGQVRGDLKDGEVLLPGALDALERSVQFVKDPSKRSR
jgi:dipeptidyl aminopeptidase/acylaminoacyl peptidase